MERIKQAIELARKARGGAGLMAGRSVPSVGAVAPGGNGSLLGPINYTTTRTFQVAPKVLREHRVVAGFEPCDFTEAFKILATRVSLLMRENGWRTLGVTSADTNEGKSLVAVNLAISLAMEHQQTALLVDADLRQPAVREYFGLPAGPGLCDHLVNRTPIEELFVNPGIDRFVLLPGGAPHLHSAEMLGSQHMARLVTELRDRYPSRTIVFDLPPLLGAADVLAFGPHIEAVLLVVEEGKTARDHVRRAAELLRPAHLIGTVLNKSDTFASVYGKSRA
jgi:capsular exopolysaccharide synthesis family protein